MLLVRTVSGPAQVVAGDFATYRATSFNMAEPSDDELKEINWLIIAGNKTVTRLINVGDKLEFEVPEDLVGKTIRVMPFRNTATEVVSVLSTVVDHIDSSPNNNNVIFLTREQWNADPNLPRKGVIVDPSKRTEIFIHHTVIVDDDNTLNEWEDIEEVKTQMRKLQTVRESDLGADVPYSLVAYCMSNGDLVLGEGRGINRSGAHTKGHNTSALGISFQGNFEKLPLPTHFDNQLIELGNWLRDLRQNQGFINLGNKRPLGREVFAHRDVKPTACPGEHLFNKLNLIRFL